MTIKRYLQQDKLGNISSGEKEFLLNHVCDTMDKVRARFEECIRLNFGKKKVLYVSTMVSIIEKHFVWNISVRMGMRFKSSRELKKVSNWVPEDKRKIFELMDEYYKYVGSKNLEFESRLEYETSVHFNKKLSYEEIESLYDDTKNKFENGVIE
ncbi:MAG: hypothetical protein KG003_07980 [Bacteroidetes bacterium]|nr:hypothetical protein [Bacteroidota bacterium]